MTFLQRLSFYGIGVFIGSLFLIVFFSGKKTSCDYGPEARVLKNINTKMKILSDQELHLLKSHQLDTAAITEAVKNGYVDFSSSDTSLDSCKVYVIKANLKSKQLHFKVRNCAKKAYFDEINIENSIQ